MLAHHDASIGLRGIEQDRPEREQDETSKSRRCLIKITQFLFSHIGLVGLVVVYAVAGGFLFELLEAHQERVSCQEAHGEQIIQITKLKQRLIAYIQYNTTSTVASSNVGDDKDNTTVAFAKIGTMLYEYRNFVIDSSSKYRYSGDDCTSVNKWTYPNALLFSITIFTTIGYGNITSVQWKEMKLLSHFVFSPLFVVF